MHLQSPEQTPARGFPNSDRLLCLLVLPTSVGAAVTVLVNVDDNKYQPLTSITSNILIAIEAIYLTHGSVLTASNTSFRLLNARARLADELRLIWMPTVRLVEELDVLGVEVSRCAMILRANSRIVYCGRQQHRIMHVAHLSRSSVFRVIFQLSDVSVVVAADSNANSV